MPRSVRGCKRKMLCGVLREEPSEEEMCMLLVGLVDAKQ